MISSVLSARSLNPHQSPISSSKSILSPSRRHLAVARRRQSPFPRDPLIRTQTKLPPFYLWPLSSHRLHSQPQANGEGHLAQTKQESSNVSHTSRELNRVSDYLESDFIWYKRISHIADVLVELQTSIVSYKKILPEGFSEPRYQVDLVSVIHYADRRYYENLQERLASYDCVLYELIQSKYDSEQEFSTEKSITSLLLMDSQADCLNHKDNWYNADLDLETFYQLSLEDKDREHMDDSGCMIRDAVELGIAPAFTVKFAKILSSTGANLNADMFKDTVIVGERNKVAIEELKRAISRGEKRIAILYGAAHMPDFGRRLRHDFKMVPTDVDWLTAWSIKRPKSKYLGISGRLLPYSKEGFRMFVSRSVICVYWYLIVGSITMVFCGFFISSCG